jgi:hypothetical protein
MAIADVGEKASQPSPIWFDLKVDHRTRQCRVEMPHRFARRADALSLSPHNSDGMRVLQFARQADVSEKG